MSATVEVTIACDIESCDSSEWFPDADDVADARMDTRNDGWFDDDNGHDYCPWCLEEIAEFLKPPPRDPFAPGPGQRDIFGGEVES